MIIGTLCAAVAIVAIIVIATYLLIPLPLLSYGQGRGEVQQGEVTGVKKIRPGVIEVSLSQILEIDPGLQEKDDQGHVSGVTRASSTRFIHIRGKVGVPKIGDKIWVVSVNKLHRFTGRSFNWVKKWCLLKGDAPVGGKVKLCSTIE